MFDVDASCPGADFPDDLYENRSQYEIWWTFGWPYETSAAMARMVFSGFFDRLPNLKIVTHHMGGMVPYFEGASVTDGISSARELQIWIMASCTMKKRPVDYFKMFYADTALFGAAAGTTRCGLEFFGLDHVMLASDVPFLSRALGFIFEKPPAASRLWD